MKKLFKEIRNFNLEGVQAIIEKKPETISCVATPPPKKDMGQSPLQVAVKIGAFDIAYYLMEQGADVNFMEEEAEGVTLRMPILQDAIRTTLHSLCYGRTEESEQGLQLVKNLLEKGADPNKCASSGFAALDSCVADAEYILESPGAYPNVQKEAETQLIALLDLLIQHGADYMRWAEKGHYPEPSPLETNRERYLDDFVPEPDVEREYTLKGRVFKTVVKGDVDRTQHMRAIMQKYWKEHGYV